MVALAFLGMVLLTILALLVASWIVLHEAIDAFERLQSPPNPKDPQ